MNNGNLPASFTEHEVKKAYLSAKSQAASGGKLSAKQAEFYLYLFKSLDMVSESIDLCDNFEAIVNESSS